MGNELEIMDSIFNHAVELRDIDQKRDGDKSTLIPWEEQVATGEPKFDCDCGRENSLWIPVFYGMPHHCTGCGAAYKPHIDGVELLRDERGNNEGKMVD